MAHDSVLQTDPGVNQDIDIRRARACTIIFRHFSDEDHLIAYPLTDAYRFILKALPETSDDDAILDYTTADTLVIDSNELQIPLTTVTTNIDRPKVWYEVIDTTTGKNWYQGWINIGRGKATDNDTVEVDLTVDIGDTVVEVTLNLSILDPTNLTVAQKQAWATALAPYLV